MKHILATSLLIIFLIVCLLGLNKTVYAAANHIVISQIQIGGTTSTDEFVELYNPTDSSVSLNGWRLTRKTSGGTQTNLVASVSGIIASHGYFLVSHPDYDGLVASDLIYSATSSSVAANNTVLLYQDAGINLIDKVGFGTASDNETSPFPTNPPTNGSLHRKNDGDDTDNNSNDFEILNTSNPRNTLTSNTTPSPTITATPTQTSTPSPTPTIVPSATPTSTPTSEPTVLPSESPTPTSLPSPTANPTLSPTPKSHKNEDHEKDKHRLEEVHRRIKHIKEVVVSFCKQHFKFLSSQTNRRGGKERD